MSGHRQQLYTPDIFAASFSQSNNTHSPSSSSRSSPHRPSLLAALSGASSTSSASSAALSTPATSRSLYSFAGSPGVDHSKMSDPLLSPSSPPQSSAAAEPLSPDNMSRPLASAAPIHSFPLFLLSLLTALESAPSSVAHHLSNLAASHAAPATFEASPQGKPSETDAIVASLSRIAERLQDVEGAEEQRSTIPTTANAVAGEEEDATQKHNLVEGLLASGLAAVGLSPKLGAPVVAVEHEEAEQPSSSSAAAADKLRQASPRRPIVVGETVEEVRQNCERQIQALKVLHAEELHRAQLSHDNEVRYVLTFSFPLSLEVSRY